VWLGSIAGANVAVGTGSVAAGITSVGRAVGDAVCAGLACAVGVVAAGTVAVGVAKMTTSTSGGTKGAGLWQAAENSRRAQAAREAILLERIKDITVSTLKGYTPSASG